MQIHEAVTRAITENKKVILRRSWKGRELIEVRSGYFYQCVKGDDKVTVWSPTVIDLMAYDWEVPGDEQGNS